MMTADKMRQFWIVVIMKKLELVSSEYFRKGNASIL